MSHALSRSSAGHCGSQWKRRLQYVMDQNGGVELVTRGDASIASSINGAISNDIERTLTLFQGQAII